MFLGAKITEFIVLADDFSKEFALQRKKYIVTN